MARHFTPIIRGMNVKFEAKTSRAFHVLFESQTLHETQDYQYLKLVALVQFKPDRL